jgi:hypothetical protein
MEKIKSQLLYLCKKRLLQKNLCICTDEVDQKMKENVFYYPTEIDYYPTEKGGFLGEKQCMKIGMYTAVKQVFTLEEIESVTEDIIYKKETKEYNEVLYDFQNYEYTKWRRFEDFLIFVSCKDYLTKKIYNN